jgi:hypothetical protein
MEVTWMQFPKWWQLHTYRFLRTNASLQPTFLSVLLVDGHPGHLASSTEVTLLLNMENHTKSCILALSALHTLLSTLLKFLLHFSPVYSKIWCIHAVLQNTPLSRHTRITNWMTHTCTSQGIAQQSNVQQPYSKQEMSECTQPHLCPGAEVCANIKCHAAVSPETIWSHKVVSAKNDNRNNMHCVNLPDCTAEL